MKWNFNNLSLADLPKARCEKPSICPVYFPDFSYRNKNTSLPGNMLPDAELYVKNKVSRTFVSKRMEILHFPSFFSLQCVRKGKSKLCEAPA
jgi:hypothetical protein